MKINKSNKLLTNFDFPNPENIVKGEGIYLYTKNKKYTDATSGLTGTAILGWKNMSVNFAINNQLKKIPHVDYKYFRDENREKLAKLLLSKAKHKLNKIFFVGASGGEACEAAMKISYQYNCAKGNPEKKWFISRKQSYHGSGSDAMSLGDRPNLQFYKPFFPKFRSKIQEHNIYRGKRKDESVEDYENRSVNDLEKKIISLGPKNVSGFVAETMMGGLIGDVPPTKNYWKKIRKVCDKYKVHLILDEVWCGTGTSGKIYCIDWDEITPDIIFMGKTLAAGYFPVSAIVTKKEIGETIKKKFDAIQFSTTHQGHSVGIAASLAVQKIIHKKNFLNNVNKNGNYLRRTIYEELKNHEFFSNVRGRGLRNSLEYKCDNQHLFGVALTEFAKEKLNLLISAKWHRVCLCHAININKKDIDHILEKFIYCFKSVSNNWTRKNIKKINHRIFF